MKRGSPDPPLDTTHDDYDCILYPIKLLVLGEWEQQEACNQKVTEASQKTVASSGDPTHPHNSAQNTKSYGSYHLAGSNKRAATELDLWDESCTQRHTESCRTYAMSKPQTSISRFRSSILHTGPSNSFHSILRYESDVLITSLLP